MKTRKWFDYKDAANELGISYQNFYAIMRNKDLKMKRYLSSTGRKSMISKKGLDKLRREREPKILVIKYYKVRSLIKTR